MKELMEIRESRSGKRWLWLPVILLVVTGYAAWALERPLPPLTPVKTSSTSSVTAPAGTLAWPGSQAAVGIAGSKTLQTHGAQTGLPTASTAKLITVLSVLQKHPLAPGQQGPMITLTDRDVTLYNNYMNQHGSVMQVVAGEQISEYQMLQAILLPSANNIADSLAIWSFGSLNNYSAYANDYVKKLGLTNTRVGSDASGLAPTTVSSAQDLVRLGELAVQNPVLASIVSQQTAAGLPIVNNVKNVNFLLGTDGIVGVKTGNSDQAGGVFVGAAKTSVNGKDVTLVTAVTGSASLFSAMKESLTLIRSSEANFRPVTVVRKGGVVGVYRVPWSRNVAAIASNDIKLSAWANSNVPYTVNLRPVKADTKGSVGTVTVQKSAVNNPKSTSVKLKYQPGKPSLSWRLLHPLP